MFKKCPKCSFQWDRRLDFLQDPRLEPIGYQVNFKSLAAGIFLFNHDCKGTLAIPAREFQDLYHGPIFKDRATGSPECTEKCLHQGDLTPCPAQCECAFVREILQVVRNWPKKTELLSSDS
jgi:hypothetical protein